MDVQKRFDELHGELEKIRKRLSEIPEQLKILEVEASTLMRAGTRIEGAMTILKEQGALPVERATDDVEPMIKVVQ